MAMAVAAPPVTREELARIAINNLAADPAYAYYLFRSFARRAPGLFPGYTYFGTLIDGMPKIVNRRPVSWKGKSFGKEGALVLPEGTPRGVLSGLRRAISISKAAAGTTGVWGMRVGPNTYVILPKKAIEQVARAARAEKRAVGESLKAAGVSGANIVDVMVSLGTAPRMVRPKTALGIPRARVRRRR